MHAGDLKPNESFHFTGKKQLSTFGLQMSGDPKLVPIYSEKPEFHFQ